MDEQTERTPRLVLKRLKHAAETALRDAEALKRTTLEGEAVNWADLHCTSAEWRVDDEGCEYYAVIIEEASPEAIKLARHVSAALKEKGFTGVLVLTEW